MIAFSQVDPLGAVQERVAPFSHDVLARSRPRRLRLREGAWELELERFDRMSGALYRPKHLAVIGPAAIREALTSLASSPAFQEEVNRVMEEPHGTDAVYEVTGDGLRAVSAMEERVSSIESAKRLVAAEMEVAQLRARVARLEQAFGALRRGGFSAAGPASSPHASPSLGASQPAGGAHAPSSPAGAPASTPGPAASANGAAPGREAQDGSAPPRGAQDANAPDASAQDASAQDAGGQDAGAPDARPEDAGAQDAGAQDAGVAEADAPADTPQEEPAAQIPSAADLSRILEGLLGAPVPLSDAEPLEIDASCYGCMLLDDEDRIVGAFVADLKATVMLGGTLMMIPDNVLEECLESGEPTEDMLEAMSEVLNVSSRAFNDVPGNPHVRTEVLAPLDLDTHPWLPTPTARTDHAEPNGGVIAMVVCPKPE